VAAMTTFQSLSNPAALLLASRLCWRGQREDNSRMRNEYSMTQPVVEKQALLESMDNDADFLKEIIGIFLADSPKMLAEIRSGVAAKDPVKVMRASHTLKGCVSCFAAKSAVEAASIIESMGRQEKLEGVKEALCILERELALVSLALEEIAKGDDRPL
jgi:HPt (histidine-containing phosphotransfer) domain-containing protein